MTENTPKKKKTQTNRKNKSKFVLYVGVPGSYVVEKLENYKKTKEGKDLHFLLLHNDQDPSKKRRKIISFFDQSRCIDFNEPSQIANAVHECKGEIVAVAQAGGSSSYVPLLAKVIPHVPYVKAPTPQSLVWASSKLDMRRKFRIHDPSITPEFQLAKDHTKKTLDEIEENVGYPLVVKPSGLASSLLVTIAYHREELKEALKRILSNVGKVYETQGGRGEPQVLVETFMEGKMYSMDVYVDSEGRVFHCPLVYVKTGREIGFDDFFGYRRTTPTNVNGESVTAAKEVCCKAVHALGLRNTTVHIELMRTEEGWKVIELGPRMGGFRDLMYQLSYGIDHTINDLRVRMDIEPVIPEEIQGYVSVMQFFAEKEGRIKSLKGVRKVRDLESFESINVRKTKGDRAIFAKHGGKGVFNIKLCNKDRSKLLADIRRVEKATEIKVE